MDFKDKLNYYIKELNITSKELSNKSNISESVISRYKKGERTPLIGSNQLNKLITALNNINIEKQNPIKENIKIELEQTIEDKDNFNYESLDTLIKELNININKMAKYINFDQSHISRIRYGKSKPRDPINFATKVTNYIIEKHNTNEDINIIKSIIGNENDIEKETINYLTTTNKQDQKIINFLEKFNDFNLNDYIKEIKFDELKIPTIPFYKAKTKNYYGLEEMKQAELDFFKTTVLSKTKEDIFMYSNMPMEDMAKDLEFSKKWMFAIACCLKKGLHLNIIHNLDRPYNEMMLGLQSWIPIYMTGQVSPYYFKNNKNNIYNQIDYTSKVAALSGECINGSHRLGKYYLTTNKKEVEYYNQKTNLLLKKANPLMEIYKEEQKEQFKNFLKTSYKTKAKRTRIYSSLPLFTIDDNTLKNILINNKLTNTEINKIIKYKHEEEKTINEILKDNIINDIITKSNSNETINLSLENIFYKDIKYTYEDYLKHYEQTIKYEQKNKNYKVTITNNKPFNNITITILENNYVILTKSKNPTIHFVIKHEKLVNAITNYNPLIK